MVVDEPVEGSPLFAYAVKEPLNRLKNREFQVAEEKDVLLCIMSNGLADWETHSKQINRIPKQKIAALTELAIQPGLHITLSENHILNGFSQMSQNSLFLVLREILQLNQLRPKAILQAFLGDVSQRYFINTSLNPSLIS